MDVIIVITVFENHRKSRIQHCERSEIRLHGQFWRVFENLKFEVKKRYQTGIRQKLVENAKVEKKVKCDILSNFQTL